jgi:FO synthase
MKDAIHELSWCNTQTLQGTTWTDEQQRVSPAVRAAIERVLSSLDGGVLTRDECVTLANSDGDDLFGLVVAANELRRRLAGDVISYVITRNINFTNVCFVGCKFCAFSVGPRDETAYFLSLDEVAQKCREAEQWGATEVCIQGGLPRDLTPFYYRDILRAVKSATPKMHAHAFSPMEMVYGVELTGLPVREYLLMLKANGLDTLPGTAAEILDDSVRHVLSRNKLSSAQWREVIETAHECGIRSTSTMMYGHSETPEHWVDQMLLLRDIQSRTGGFTEFVPLGFIHENTLLFAQGLARSGGTLAEHMKVHALARIILAGSIHHIQVSWVKLGRELSQLALLAGADDYGGTLFEENISRLAGSTAGQYTSATEFQQRIIELGRIPAQRNTLYTQYTYPTPEPTRNPVSAGEAA